MRRRSAIEKKISWMAVLACLICLGMLGGEYVFAKYFSQSVKNGIAIASGIYFTANYAVESSDEDVFFESVVKTGYQGTDTEFMFEVRNYENNMLFNESSVEIPYSVYFWLGETPVGAAYSVEYDGETKLLHMGESNRTGFEGHSITGGRAVANKYTIQVNVDGAGHTPVPIYVLVETEPEAVINKQLRGKMIFSSTIQSEHYIESQMFAVSQNASTEEERFEELQKLSEFSYEIRTVGEVISGEGATETLKISWNPEILEIDIFDDAFVAWENSSGEDMPLVDERGWNYVIVHVMPYSAEVIGFFRGEQFSEKVTDWETLHSYIHAEKYLETGEGAE